MNRKELIAKCGESLEWQASAQIRVVVTPENDPSDPLGVHIFVQTDQGKVDLWVMNHHDTVEDGIFNANTGIKNASRNLQASQILATFFNLDIPMLVQPTVDRPVEVVKEVETVSGELFELRGEVRVYEKLLIGRAFNVSK